MHGQASGVSFSEPQRFAIRFACQPVRSFHLPAGQGALVACGADELHVNGRAVFASQRDEHIPGGKTDTTTALRNVSPSLLWAIKLRLRREELSPTFTGDDRDSIKDVAYLVGEALTRAAAALQDSILNEAPLLENIGLYRPPLTGIDLDLYRHPMRRQKLAESIRAQRAKLQESSQK